MRQMLIDINGTLIVCLHEHVNIYFGLLCTTCIYSTFNRDLYIDSPKIARGYCPESNVTFEVSDFTQCYTVSD